jgi:flagellar hook assembly protein FlgD
LGIEEGQVELPFDFKLGANYPNPFNAETIIPLEGEVHQGNVTIYDIAGRQIKDFAINENTYQIQWDGTNSAGKTVASGTYFYSVSFDGIGTAATKKMTLLK